MSASSNRPLALIFFSAALLFAGGCASGPSNSGRHSSHTLTAFANSSWVLVAWKSDGKKFPIPSTPPTLQLGYQGRVGGQAGVNRYFGTVQSFDDKLVWSEALGSTRMAGEPAAMEAEKRYLEDLASTTEVTVRNNHLIFSGKGARLEFARSLP